MSLNLTNTIRRPSQLIYLSQKFKPFYFPLENAYRRLSLNISLLPGDDVQETLKVPMLDLPMSPFIPDTCIPVSHPSKYTCLHICVTEKFKLNLLESPENLQSMFQLTTPLDISPILLHNILETHITSTKILIPRSEYTFVPAAPVSEEDVDEDRIIIKAGRFKYTSLFITPKLPISANLQEKLTQDYDMLWDIVDNTIQLVYPNIPPYFLYFK